jgi:uncharacterized protein (TIGR02145 family)
MKKEIWIYQIMSMILSLTSSCKKDSFNPPINFNQSVTYGSMADRDGNTYKTVAIGNQVWMAENLKTTRYRNGDLIPNVTDNSKWIGLTTGAYSWYNNDINNKAVYGALYNWFAIIDNRNIAPDGWHVPAENEWDALITYLGAGTAASIKLRENGTTHWTGYNAEKANLSGFTGLPAGMREYIDGKFYGIETYCWWWSPDSDKENNERAWIRGLDYWYPTNIAWNKVDNLTIQKIYGASVRCIKDN